MIQITYKRFGPICAAATTNDNREVTIAFGLTEQGASNRLIRALNKKYEESA